ncbi:Pentatricopeptide repeat-containing protein At5g38730 [Linum perenne]
METFVPSRFDSRLVHSICAVVIKGCWPNLLKPKIDFNLTPNTFQHILLRLTDYSYNPFLPWTLFRWIESSFPNYKHSVQSSWTMIHILTKHKHFKTAHQLLEKVAYKDFLSSPSVLTALVKTHDDPEVNSHILSWLVIVYGNSRMTHEAMQVFEHMRASGLKPHLHACTVLLNTLVKDKLTDTVWKVYKKMVKVGVVANIHVFNVLIHACCKSGDVEKAEKLLTEMELKGVFPDLFTYNTLISLYCRKGMHYEALSVQGRMDSAGIIPDIVTHNSLIYAFCREGRMREAMRLFKEIKDVIPNHVTYTTLIDGYCRLNDLEAALSLRDSMADKGLYPTVVTYNSILRKLCEGGRIRDANKLLSEMGERNVQADNITCNTLINAYCKIGDMASALKVKDKMMEVGLKLDLFTYKALIHGFCKARDMKCAKEYLFSMLNAGFSPSFCTYSWVVDVHCDQQKEEDIIKLPDEFIGRGLCVDVSLYRCLIRGFCRKGKLDCAKKIFGLMKEKDISGDSVVYTSLAYSQWKVGNVSAASDLLDEMYKKRLMITLKIYKSFSASYAGDDKILSLFWSHVADRRLMSKSILKDLQQ